MVNSAWGGSWTFSKQVTCIPGKYNEVQAINKIIIYCYNYYVALNLRYNYANMQRGFGRGFGVTVENQANEEPKLYNLINSTRLGSSFNNSQMSY